jgi:hypothetical protein
VLIAVRHALVKNTGRIKCFCATPVREDTCKLVYSFSIILFPLLIFTWYHFAVINNCECHRIFDCSDLGGSWSWRLLTKTPIPKVTASNVTNHLESN